MRRLIIFLVRTKLGLKKFEAFRFTNQKTDNIYFFTDDRVMKKESGIYRPSNVSLNWLLDDNCEIEILGTRL